ncbi:MTAP family purine nucleoside phosphorylase [Phytoactinopolyspora mesophila]|uniref:Purine nucleoside phosphorylase n=1 Tax=Phytoactinopolyspora mesophila TaxID=2650750 RepID=A0A7K3M4H9_9ACTN|nr:MTAP family purine nucleoside phosphorylase [Phytoactinopolyspora mesophila]NDL58155.1 S-methyl-5'-thioadenosine phosphorylase [Phytoactinopolyspora mesophila]
MNNKPHLKSADVGVFGGSGFYTFVSEQAADLETVSLDTAWGQPSAPVTIATFRPANGSPIKVAFLPRHGVRHQFPPHRVNYRANVDAMRQLGVRALVAPFAAGSLRSEIGPGEFVVVDQLVDRTRGRADTFYDHFDEGPQHLPFADPYDPRLREVLLDAARASGVTVHDGGTVVVTNGPRFSTRAESAAYRAAGWHVINMTQYPEAALAGEAGIPFAGIALVTDYDAGLDDDPGVQPVTQETVFQVFEENLHRVRALLAAAIPNLP